MSYAHIENDTITSVRGTAPKSGRTTNGSWVLGIDSNDTVTLESVGWYEIVPTPKPTPAVGNTVDRTVEIVDGVPTVVWIERPKTEEELDDEALFVTQNRIEQGVNDAISTLTEIENTDLNNTQAVAAIQAEAEILRKLIVLVVPELLDNSEATVE